MLFPRPAFITQHSVETSCPNSPLTNTYQPPSLATAQQTHTCQSPALTSPPQSINQSPSLAMADAPSTDNTPINSSVSNICVEPTESVRPAILGADCERR